MRDSFERMASQLEEIGREAAVQEFIGSGGGRGESEARARLKELRRLGDETAAGRG
jgi:muramoyltetrapeptide carboxypeptidase LdcA involved in peptidoglycan recycling